MNKAQRKRLLPLIVAIRGALESIEDCKGIFEEVRDEEQEKFDNMPENMQGGEKGDTLRELIEALSAIVDWEHGLDDALGTIEEA